MRIPVALATVVVAGFVLVVPAPEPLTSQVVAADPEKKTVAAPTYKNDIEAFLATNCVKCHNPKKKKAGVDLQSLPAVMEVVKVNQPEQSWLYKSLVGKGAKRMPPKTKLPADQIELVKTWIASGAK